MSLFFSRHLWHNHTHLPKLDLTLCCKVIITTSTCHILVNACHIICFISSPVQLIISPSSTEAIYLKEDCNGSNFFLPPFLKKEIICLKFEFASAPPHLQLMVILVCFWVYICLCIWNFIEPGTLFEFFDLLVTGLGGQKKAYVCLELLNKKGRGAIGQTTQ